MVEMRWLVKGMKQTLQMRQYINTTVYAGMPDQDFINKNANMQWSPWKDIPIVDESAKITSEMVTRLRDETNYPMMECKTALMYADGDHEQAKEWLRKGWRI